MTRHALALVGTLAVLTLAMPAHATLNACTAAKKLCVAKKAAALLKCHSKNEKPPAGLEPAKFAACIQKAQDKFDGGTNPSKGCFAKLEAKFGPANCVTSGDTAALEQMTDDWVDAVVCALDPAGGTCPATPTPTPTSTPGCVANGGSCANAAQCCSLSCSAGTCVASCSNGMQDGNETGVDCGGGSCPACPVGGGCNLDNDCVANAQCVSGQCACMAGFSDCNLIPADGCEASLVTDANNCGGCGNVCLLPNATEVCNMAQCQVGSCDPDYANCNNVTADGCEVNTGFDPNNCGGCGLLCPNPMTCVNAFCN